MALSKPRNTDAGSVHNGNADIQLIANEEHPDFVAGRLSDAEVGEFAGFTPNPEGTLPRPGLPERLPRPEIPFPVFCAPVSGRYRHTPPAPSSPGPVVPTNLLRMTVRVDVDRFYPQQRISIEVNRLFPSGQAHAIAEVTSDSCTAYNRRRITANITYRDGDASLIPGTTVTFTANRTTGFGYGTYQLTLSGGGITPKSYAMSFESIYFDKVEFEVDVVNNAGTAVSSYDTGSHPNRPASLPAETVSLATIYQRAGFDTSLSGGANVISVADAGANGTWSDTEMHNAMVAYWSRFANQPQWAMWVLYAARHDQGPSLGGIMFDDIGPNHRQGTAIFTDSFIKNAPGGDANPDAWSRRMQFWTAIHEIGHGFNLAHSWQKALGTPWIQLANEPEARSFMNYPYNVSGGQSSFFSDFQFRFSDSELVFMRHAPRRFVQMGNSNWFDNHGFEQPDALRSSGNWQLSIRPNRSESSYRFLEPVTLELKLANTSGKTALVEGDLLADGRHLTIFVQREGGSLRQHRPMVTRCHRTHQDRIASGEAIYGSHMISTSTEGWLIDEPGFYKIQAAIDLNNEILVSNVMRLYVTPPATLEEGKVAGSYFSEEVGRVLAFAGAPELNQAEEVLREVIQTCPDNPAALHAEVALSNPQLRQFKVLQPSDTGKGIQIASQHAAVEQAAKSQISALLNEPEKAADTIGHIAFFSQLLQVADAMKADGNNKGALEVLSKTIKVMKSRHILGSVIEQAEAQINQPG